MHTGVVYHLAALPDDLRGEGNDAQQQRRGEKTARPAPALRRGTLYPVDTDGKNDDDRRREIEEIMAVGEAERHRDRADGGIAADERIRPPIERAAARERPVSGEKARNEENASDDGEPADGVSGGGSAGGIEEVVCNARVNEQIKRAHPQKIQTERDNNERRAEQNVRRSIRRIRSCTIWGARSRSRRF